MEKELRVRFTGDAGDLRRAARDAEHAMRETERAQRDGAISAAELGKKLGTLAAAYLSLQAAAAAAQKGIQNLASIEQNTLTFEVLFQDADKAKRKMEELVQFAKVTPFELPGIVEAAKALETFGLDSTKYLKNAGDLAAAFNVEINEVARAFGRINSGDFGEAFERMRDFGISRQMLEGEGLVFDKSGSYQGSVDQALTAVQNIIERKFGGMMEKQSGTFTGQMANLGDSIDTMLGTTMTPAFEQLRDVLNDVNQGLEGAFGEEMQANAKVLGDVIGGITTATVALTKATGDTLNEIMAPLRWLRETSAALGHAAGERSVAKSLVASDPTINPNRRAHYANLVGRGEDLGNISRDFRVRSWGDAQGVQEDLGKIARSIAKARQIVTMHDESGGAAAKASPSATTPPKAKAADPKSTKSGKTPREIQESWVDGMVEESVDALELRLGGLMHGQSQGMTTATSRLTSGLVRGTNYGMGLGFTSLDTRLADAMQTPSGVLGLADPGSDSSEAEARKLLDQWNKESAKGVETHKEWLNSLDEKTREKAEASLRSGLEAGVTAFLDGGIGNLGEATYSLSKKAFSDALVDGVMNSDLKDAFGGLGEALGSALSHPVTAAVAVAAMGVIQIKQAFDDVDNHTQRLEDQRKRYVNGMGPNEELRNLAREREGYRRSADNPAPGWMLWGGGHKDAVKSKLSTYDSFLSDAAKSAFDSGFNEKKALEFKSLDAALTYTHGQVLKFADANELSAEITNGLITAKTEETKIAYESAKAAKAFADSLGSYGGLMKSFDWIEKLGGGKMDAQDLKYAGLAATGGGLDISRIDQQEAIRLAELYGKMQYGGEQGAAQYGVGMTKPKTSREQIVEILGYDPGRNEHGDKLVTMLDQMILPMLARRQDLMGGPAAAAIGSMSNPDQALQFDAPVNRNVINNYTITVQSHAFMGNKAEAREWAQAIGAELRNIEGQAV